MRAPGEVRIALGAAARALVRHEAHGMRGPTLQEMATHARVGIAAATSTVKNMTRFGELRCISGRRKVSYRNRPVAEYLPHDVEQQLPDVSTPEIPGFSALAAVWK